MSAELAMETQRLLERTSWEWQEAEPILQEMMTLIAPGRALRKYDLNKANSDKSKTGVGPDRPLTESEKIKSGARVFARSSFNQQKKSGRIESKIVDGVEYFRFAERRVRSVKPCESCGHVESLDPKAPVLKLSQSAPASNVIQFPIRKAI